MLNIRPTQAAPKSRLVRNQMLSTLDDRQFDTLRRFLTVVELKKNKVIFDAKTPVKDVYFVESGIVSRLATTSDDGYVEVGMVGRFGFVGISVVLGSENALHRTTVLIPGQAISISADALRGVMIADPTIRDHLLRYVQMLFSLKAQISLCNAKHNIDQRVARWLLLARDRMGNDEIPITHDYLARALGVRRPGVSEALARLVLAGALSKQRAAIKIESHEAVLASSCQCYRLIDQAYAPMRQMLQFEHFI